MLTRDLYPKLQFAGVENALKPCPRNALPALVVAWVLEQRSATETLANPLASLRKRVAYAVEHPQDADVAPDGRKLTIMERIERDSREKLAGRG